MGEGMWPLWDWGVAITKGIKIIKPRSQIFQQLSANLRHEVVKPSFHLARYHILDESSDCLAHTQNLDQNMWYSEVVCSVY